jgi:hypothetical protein
MTGKTKKVVCSEVLENPFLNERTNPKYMF